MLNQSENSKTDASLGSYIFNCFSSVYISDHKDREGQFYFSFNLFGKDRAYKAFVYTDILTIFLFF